MGSPESNKTKKGAGQGEMGGLIGVILIVSIFLIGGIYLWQEQLAELERKTDDVAPETSNGVLLPEQETREGSSDQQREPK